ncbi:uncharacterized protein N7443_010679 [Penicillium atrosanguineum]|uniref:uncharacterized protein n=1 Tax=Penicillium atrosanguineum TaxID=1132637 RepID=UPI002392926C|nr:uncharacterized protein N7443_010679 [Penicillium atrosanguineum]KAJ5290426.1 hypothetical protein N7443_010679 [Penicillium atrosanguineum]
MPSSRRSGRVQANTKYNTDPFASVGISDESDSEKTAKTAKAPKGKGKRRVEESASDEEFVAPGSDADMNEGPDDDDDDVSEEAEEVGAEEIDDGDEMEVESTASTPKRKATHARPHVHKRRPPNNEVAPSPDEIHFRGIMDPKDHVAKPMHYALTFGSDERDLLSAMYMRDRWFRGIDACLPTRFALEQPEGSDYGYGPTMGIEPEQFRTEQTRGWDWFYDDLGKKLQKQQTLSEINEADALQIYFTAPKSGKHTILMGPTNQQTPIQLGYQESYNFGKIWKNMKARKSDQSAQSQVREGWLMNFGSKVQCIAWAPNQDGLSQYMAVVAPLSDEQKKIYHPAGSEPLSPFHPTPPYSCALQLWEFKGKKTGERTNTLDMEFEPRLRLALCSDWGDLRRMAWCPMGREKRSKDKTGDREHLGLLAGIWGDGILRVLDISIQRKSEKAEFLKIVSPIFEAKPPSTLCSSLTWLSPSDIAVGCNNGFVAIWNIQQSNKSDKLPYFYHPVHTSYVLSIASAYPTNPHLLSTIAMDGETRLWSMLDPTGESASTPRMRIASPHLCYAPVLFSFFSTDENNFGRMLPTRRFFASSTVGRCPSTVSCVAQPSFWHPCLMYGGCGGEVMASNPFRRLLYNKEQQWQQLWFTHDWAQGADPHSSGVSRFYDGYQADSQSLARNLAGEKKPSLGLSLTSIHDESTHVTSLGWNPSRPCAAWASAALGCGLVRVEDLAI